MMMFRTVTIMVEVEGRWKFISLQCRYRRQSRCQAGPWLTYHLCGVCWCLPLPSHFMTLPLASLLETLEKCHFPLISGRHHYTLTEERETSYLINFTLGTRTGWESTYYLSGHTQFLLINKNSPFKSIYPCPRNPYSLFSLRTLERTGREETQTRSAYNLCEESQNTQRQNVTKTG